LNCECESYVFNRELAGRFRSVGFYTMAISMFSCGRVTIFDDKTILNADRTR